MSSTRFSPGGNIEIPVTADSTTGCINQNNVRLLNTFGTSNVFLGANAGTFAAGSHNTAIGSTAGTVLNGGTNNTMIGSAAGDSITSGGSNVLIGRLAGQAITTGNQNVLIGSSVGNSITGDNNIAIGNSAGSGITTANNTITIGANGSGTSGEIVIGDQAVHTVTTLAGNVSTNGTMTASNLSGTNTGNVTLAAVGSSPNANGASLSGQILNLQPADGTNPGTISAGSQTIGGDKTFTGFVETEKTLKIPATTSSTVGCILQAGNPILHSAGTNSIYVGANAGLTNATAIANTCVGTNAGDSITSGGSNVLIGRQAGQAITTGIENVFIGTGAGASITGDNNIAIGTGAGGNISTGSNTITIGTNGSGTSGQIAIGDAGLHTTTILVGYVSAPAINMGPPTASTNGSLYVNNTQVFHNYGTANIFVGNSAGNYTMTGIGRNSCFGSETGASLTTGTINTMIGSRVGKFITSGGSNALLSGGFGITTGSNNVCIGSGDSITTGSENIAIGRFAGNSVSTVSNTINIGNVGNNVANEINIGDRAVHTITRLSGNVSTNGTITGSNLTGTNTNDVTLATFGSTPNSSGATISSQQITLEPADGTNPGGVSTTTQTFAGAKTLSNNLTLSQNLVLTDSTASTIGVISYGANRWLHNYTSGATKSNVFLGLTTGNFTSTGIGNVMCGQLNGQNLSSGQKNACWGHNCAPNLSSGNNNMILAVDSSGLTTGSGNTFLGFGAGNAISTTSNNICIGHAGVAGDSGIIRIGTNGTHTATAIQGISGTTSPGGVAVLVNAAGTLGTTTSSIRYKKDIVNVDTSKVSKLHQLRVVDFYYKTDTENQYIQSGMIAEEVLEYFPEYISYEIDNITPMAIQYHQLYPLMLRELQLQKIKIDALEQEIIALQGA